MFKVKVRREELAKALAHSSSVVAKRSTMDIILKVMLSAEDNFLTITATDLEVTLQTRIPAEVSGSGQLAITPKTLIDFLRLTKADEVLLESGENLTLKCVSDYKSSFFGVSAEKFPFVSKPEESEFVRVDAKNLTDAITKTIYSVSTSEVAYNLKGIYFTRLEPEDAPKHLHLVSTDGQRLNVATVEAENLDVFPEEGGIIVPRKGLQELKTLCEPLVDVYLSVYDNSLVAKTDDLILKIRLLSGNFPDYTVILPRELDLRAFFNRKELLQTVTRVCVLTDEHYTLAKFHFTKDLLTVISNNPELGKIEDSLGVDYSGPEIQSLLNPNYISEILNSLHSDRVSIEFSQNSQAYLITAAEDRGYSGVIAGIEGDNYNPTIEDTVVSED